MGKTTYDAYQEIVTFFTNSIYYWFTVKFPKCQPPFYQNGKSGGMTAGPTFQISFLEATHSGGVLGLASLLSRWGRKNRSVQKGRWLSLLQTEP